MICGALSATWSIEAARADLIPAPQLWQPDDAVTGRE